MIPDISMTKVAKLYKAEKNAAIAEKDATIVAEKAKYAKVKAENAKLRAQLTAFTNA